MGLTQRERTRRRWRLAFTMGLAGWLVAPGAAMAQAEALLLFPEPIVPDLRLELASSESYLVLSFPAHLHIYHEHTILPEKATWSLFVEPQWRPSGSEWRGVAGVRLTQPVYGMLSVLGDGAGLVGTDGHGGLAGAGVGLFDDSMLGGVGMLALVWRHGWTTQEQRDDFSIDLLYPIW